MPENTRKTGYSRHFHDCNEADMGKFAPFAIGGRHYGWVARELAALLPGEIDLFVPHSGGIALASHLKDYTSRSDALAMAARFLSPRFDRKLRGEMYPVIRQWGDEPVAEIDRAAVPWFGVKGCGVHVNGFVRKPDGIHLWIGERSADRLIDPGKLDNLIGGGQPVGLTIEENLCKEAAEEAGIEASLALTAKQTGSISYLVERHNGLRNDTLFIFDLELSEHFTPKNTDGEVAAFHLMPIADVATIVHDTDRFKFNCNPVIVDFLIRHGFIGADHEEYRDIINFFTPKDPASSHYQKTTASGLPTSKCR